jgi:hypothetical protein
VSPASAGLTVRWRYRSRSRFSRAVSSSTSRAIARRISALRSRSSFFESFAKARNWLCPTKQWIRVINVIWGGYGQPRGPNVCSYVLFQFSR